MEDFTKVKLIEVPRNIVAGHDALGSIREMCENVHFGKTGTISPAPRRWTPQPGTS